MLILKLGSLLTFATNLTSCFVTGIVVTLVDTTDVVELGTLIVSLIGSFLLGAKVVNEALVALTLDVLGHFVKAAPGGFLMESHRNHCCRLKANSCRACNRNGRFWNLCHYLSSGC